jgi:transposase-like protein
LGKTGTSVITRSQVLTFSSVAPPRLDDIERRLDAGERVKVIAADLGVTPRTIRTWLHAAGLPLASIRSRQRRLALLADSSWLRRQYVDERLSAWAIGQELEMPTAEVRATLERFGIERPPARPDLTAEALRTAFADGATVRSIARTAGVDGSTVRAALRRHGVENPHADRYRRPTELDDAEWVHGRYIGARMSIRAIAAELGVEYNTVARALRRHGVPRRRRTERPDGIDPEWLRRRYIDDRLALAEIARLTGADEPTLHSALVAHGLSRSEPWTWASGGIDV